MVFDGIGHVNSRAAALAARAARPQPSRMNAKVGLAALNVVGGLAVLGSYAWGLARPEVAAGLWGGVPASLRGLYTVNMLLAAAGYFPFTSLLLFGTTPARFEEETGFSYGPATLGAYALVLGPSALWLPLTAAMIEAPSALLWLAIRLDLALVGLGALTLLFLVARIARARGGAWAWAAVIGCAPFVLQTALLDAVLWPYFWPR
jgi:hypothetical protein